MTDKKLTDNEIKKTLECCLGDSCYTSECSFFEETKDGEHCQRVAVKHALDLINRKEQENERLREILNTDFIIPLESDDTSSLVIVKIDSIKSEARKEFAENIKKHAYFDHKDQRNVVAEAIIDHYLKLGGDINDSATDN